MAKSSILPAHPAEEQILLFEDTQRAVLNILEDFSTEKLRLEEVQRATLNVLEDFNSEKWQFERTQTATLNILEDLQAEKVRQDDGQRALLNILEDMDSERGKVAAMNRQLETANKELGAFTYSVAHDLRAPVRHIDGFSKILLEQFGAELPPEARHSLVQIRSATRTMGQLVDDLLNLTRIGRQELRLQITGLTGLLNEVLASLRPETAGRDVEFRVGELPFVECDTVLMKQVFANLLGNALKFTRPRPRAVIEVGASQRNGHKVIFVRDNGVGFNMKYAEKLFGVFQRLHRAEDFEGTGVGLAIIQRIIHKHGGQVWAEAELDRGATFFFSLGGSVEEAVAPSPQGE